MIPMRKVTAAFLSLTLACAFPSLAQAPKTKPQAESARPKLLVVLVADQMRADYIERYGHQWTKGLRRLVDHGAWFRQAAYPYWNTITCAGHATIGTGTYPATHGMILNAWWDRDSKKQVECTDDSSVADVPPGAAGSSSDSPMRLRMPTLADEMRGQFAVRPRIVSLSFKARSAIGMAGHGGDAVVWYEGGWQTSGAFAKEMPAFVRNFEQAYHTDEQRRKPWTKLLPESAYLFTDDAAGERPASGDTRVFPHKTNYPAGDEALARLAMAAVDELKLGQGAGTDFLGVGFSATDTVGHAYGPRSHEVQDVLARVDASIGELLDHLDKKVGKENYVVALSADHGVSPIPDQMVAEGLDAGRVATAEVTARAEKALEPIFGPGPHVARYLYTDLYFQPGAYDKIRADAKAMAAVEAAILGVPGVWKIFRSEDLAGAMITMDPARRAAALSYYHGRSGDIIILARPYWITATAAATHGSGHGYDARVPVILMGRGILPGEYLGPASPADIAPTLAFFAGVTMARAEGRLLTEALVPAPRVPPPPLRK